MRTLCAIALALLVVGGLGAQTYQPHVKLGAPINASPASDYSPAITADNLTIYWTSARASGVGSRDVWSSTRPAVTGAWGPATNVPVVNSPSGDDYMDIAPDNLSMYISSQRPGSTGGSGIWESTRLTTAAPWGAPVLVADTLSFDDDPSVTDDGLQLFFTSGAAGGANVYVSTRTATNLPWGMPVILPSSVNSASFDHSPAISGDGLTLNFSSTRTGGLGSSDYYQSTRPTATSTAWSPPVNLGNAINTVNWDHNGQQSSDGYSFYYAYNNEIYRADKLIPLIVPTGLPQVGAPYVIACRASPGDTGVVAASLFAIPATPLPGISGLLELNLSTMVWWAVGTVRNNGEFSTTIPIPNVAALAGINLRFQSAAQDGGTPTLIGISTLFVGQIQ